MFSVQEWIAFAIVAWAVYFLVRKLFRGIEEGTARDCSACSAKELQPSRPQRQIVQIQK